MDSNSNRIKNKISVYYSGTLRQPTRIEFFKGFRILKSPTHLRTDVTVDDKEISDPCVDEK
ncbi:hypothetical protein LEP1GSC060_0644 [Leptospira weilii serovar Ranarum str. ICFT]|uniref:Uncharacterized protein n=1 Tax=Leptospira weilii serovar Ranarum str. ICFT TaxID=1218598 RepID=N1WLZ5_9LEPT|nr:hypothetical protein LEP1GSC060_0644 [Leptospira weilii serovar Ranarum str. ICFT]